MPFAALSRVLCAALPILLAAACAAPTTPTTPATAPEPAGAAPAPPPAAGVPDLDTRCRVDSDCVVKDVGNCCGAYPACVHRDSPADPQAVMAECRRTGMASVCGFREIQACACVRNRCEAADAAPGAVR